MRDCVCNTLMNRRFRSLLRHYFDYDADDNGLSPREVLAKLDSVCKAIQGSFILHILVAIFVPGGLAMMWTFFPMEPGGSGGARWWWWSPG
ncbi:hypothetical protein CDEST_13029 [Colletotrichum destructivum]|uniref:Uncharacterized protein n=1 Tax=Colletotrichum destructivum TaxID=34406 RepID=A0AAX4IXN4_9PEZI|nr:hypothetical protein CDEST_13029 [Colletotrichum destructivum]